MKRFAGEGNYANSQMKPKHIKKFRQLGLCARACHRVLKVARAIADLEAAESIVSARLLEAIQYKSLDRRLF